VNQNGVGFYKWSLMLILWHSQNLVLFRLFCESKRNNNRNDFCFLIQSDVLPKILGQTKSKSPRKSLEKPRTPKGSELPLNGGFRKSI
jgi:hypothetical protein